MYPSAANYYLKDDYLVLLVRKGASYSPRATLVSLRPNLQDTLYSALVTPSLSFILVVVWSDCGLKCSRCVGVLSQCCGFGCLFF